MLDVKELEKRWLKYKIKKTLPYLLFGFSVAVVLAVLLNIDTFSKNKEITSSQKQEQKHQIKNKEKQQLSKKPLISEKKQNKKQLEYGVNLDYIESQQRLTPSFEFMNKYKKTAVVPKTIPPKHKPKPKPQPQKKHVTYQKYQTSNIQKKTYKKNEKKVNIAVKKTSKRELDTIIRRFKKTNNPKLSLFVAKKYYELGDYHQSYNYSLITNQIDSTIEDSWIIFAKSLVKLGKKQKAIKILKAYIKTSKSKKAQLLLENIQTGKFR